MQYFLFVLLFLPLLLHSFVLVKRKSEPDLALIDSHQLSQVKNERSSDNPTVVVKVDHCTRFSFSLRSRRCINSSSILDEGVDQFAARSAISLQPDFTTTNVMLEPRKRNASAVGVGCAVYCEDDL